MRLLRDGLPVIGAIIAGGKERINGMYVIYSNNASRYVCTTREELDNLLQKGTGGFARVRVTSAVFNKDTGAVTFSAMVTEADCHGAKPEAGLTVFTGSILTYMKSDSAADDVLVAASNFVGKSGDPVGIPFQSGVYVVVNASLRFGA